MQQLDYLPFVECKEATLFEHAHSTVHGSGVGASTRVHESRFYNIHRRGNNCGEEASTKCRQEVAWHIVREKIPFNDALLDQVIRHKLGSIDNSITCYVWQYAWKLKMS